ncbi:MAG: hypothetical protein PUB21_08000 [Bacteroidales bacterium]|nr:hypothetical protein [Bacteroidales bacterium]
MINIKELRVGNYVKDRGNKILRIDYFEIDKVCQEMEVANMKVHPLTEYVEHLEPVPISIDMLLKFGFIDDSYPGCEEQIIFKLEEFWILYNRRSELYGIMLAERVVCELKYLHQLQNIYFDLQGKELLVVI